MDEKKIEFDQLGTEIPRSLKIEVELAATKRRLTLKKATEQALRMWLDTDVGGKPEGTSTKGPLAGVPVEIVSSQYIKGVREIQERLLADVEGLGELTDKTELDANARTVEAAGKAISSVQKRRR